MTAVKTPNLEPIPGYRLIEPLGRGGFGEVWKCEAPGGLLKAIKFVAGEGNQLHHEQGPDGATQELRALQHVKTIRHPFLLSMDRVERIDGELVIVMELADKSLHDLARAFQQAGQPGIPRDELVGYLREAAEVLDLMNQEYGLQHLDVKPQNLFLVSGHIKVADFGLVNSLAELCGGQPHAVQLGAITPLYAAPESFLGKITLFSDQYSLAITYHELLTGSLPFVGKNFRQLMLAHTQLEPDLSRLTETDRAVVGRALAKDPRGRFRSCLDFVAALQGTRPAQSASSRTEVSTIRPQRPTSKTSSEINLGEMTRTAAIPRDAASTGPVPAAKGDGLDGFALLECLGRAPWGEVWRALRPNREKCLLRYVIGIENEACLARFESLRHDSLAPTEMLTCAPGRIALITEGGDDSLASLYKERTAAGLPGIPRDELVHHLETAAAALDDLFRQHRLQHLGLTPRNLLLIDGRLRIADFGLAELIFMPAGHKPAELNTRYAATELFLGSVSRGADQFSLALLYAELLTGVHPFRNLNARQMASARLRTPPDLGMLPAPDRGVVLRALAPEPDHRFPSTSAFVEALAEVASGGPRRLKPATSRINVPTLSRAIERNAAQATAPALVGSQAPVLRQAIDEVVRAAVGPWRVLSFRGLRYRLDPGRRIEHHCAARLLPGTARLKLDGFRNQWRADKIARDEEHFGFRVTLGGNLLQRCLGTAPVLDVRIDLTPAHRFGELTAVRVCIESTVPEELEQVGPELLDSLRNYLQPIPERRSEERFPFSRPLLLRPVLDGEEPGEPIVAEGRDVSPRGLGLVLPGRAPRGNVYVQLGSPDSPLLPARVVRVLAQNDSRFAVGLAFVVPGSTLLQPELSATRP